MLGTIGFTKDFYTCIVATYTLQVGSVSIVFNCYTQVYEDPVQSDFPFLIDNSTIL
jgi:hypothetical protein